MKKVFLFVVILVSIVSCIDDRKAIGKWSDIIKLSTKSVELSSAVDSVMVNTGGTWWWVAEIYFQDSIYQYNNRKDIDLESDHYRIEEADFIVERKDSNTLFIRMTENPSQAERELLIVLEAGDYFDRLYVSQKSK